MKKIIGLSVSILLSGCAESVALLGPMSGSGNITQSVVSSSLSYGVKKQTGRSPSEHFIEYVQRHNPEGKKEKCIKFLNQTSSKTCAAIKENISEKKIKFAEVKKSIFNKNKIENLAKQSDLLDR